jgi:hypothetical protein
MEGKEIRYFWRPGSARGPYSPKVLEFTESSITFDGYFYEPQERLPQERILSISVPDEDEDNLKRIAVYHVEIIEKIEGEDTSEVSADDEYGAICFFPTHHITLRFRVLNKNFDKEEEDRILATLYKKRGY